jgi:hypothetical protein
MNGIQKTLQNNIAAWTAQQSSTVPNESANNTMNNSRQSKAAGISINNYYNQIIKILLTNHLSRVLREVTIT